MVQFLEIEEAILLVKAGALEEVLKRLENGDVLSRNSILFALVKYYVETEQFERAIQVANRMMTVEEDDDKWEAVGKIAYGYAVVGKFEEALQFARSLEEREYRLEALCSVIWRYSETGDFVNAFALARENEALDSGSLEETIEGAIALAVKSLNELEVEDAIAAMQDLQQQLQDDSYSLSILRELARNYADGDRRDRLIELVQLSNDKRIQAIALQHLIPPWIHATDIESVKAILRTLKIDPEYLDELLAKQEIKRFYSRKSVDIDEVLQAIEEPSRRERATAVLKALSQQSSSYSSYWKTYYCEPYQSGNKED